MWQQNKRIVSVLFVTYVDWVQVSTHDLLFREIRSNFLNENSIELIPEVNKRF